MRDGPDCAERSTLLIGIDAPAYQAAVTTVLSTESGTMLGNGLPEDAPLVFRPTCRHAWARSSYCNAQFLAWFHPRTAGSFARKKKILPVWHHLTAAQIAKYSPILADRKAADTRKGLQHVAEQIVIASFPQRVANLPLSSAAKTDKSEAADAQKVLRALLKGKPNTDDLYLYLSGYPILLQNIVGYVPELIPGFKLPGPVRCDFAELAPHGVTGPVEILFVVLGPVDYDENYVIGVLQEAKQTLGTKVELEGHPVNDYLGAPYFGQFPKMKKMGVAIQKLVRSENVHWNDPDTWSFQFKIITGRRNHDLLQERSEIAKRSGLRVDIASYDRLLDDRSSVYG
jgi:hypothetical protein